jgi:hypothetical protein
MVLPVKCEKHSLARCTNALVSSDHFIDKDVCTWSIDNNHENCQETLSMWS